MAGRFVSPEEVRGYYTEFAPRYGLNPEDLMKLTQLEAAQRDGMFDAQSSNPKSSAYGLSQFTTATGARTILSYVNEYVGPNADEYKKLAETSRSILSKPSAQRDGLVRRFTSDPRFSAYLTTRYLADDLQKYRAATGREQTGFADLYAVHHQGLGGAIRIAEGRPGPHYAAYLAAMKRAGEQPVVAAAKPPETAQLTSAPIAERHPISPVSVIANVFDNVRELFRPTQPTSLSQLNSTPLPGLTRPSSDQMNETVATLNAPQLPVAPTATEVQQRPPQYPILHNVPDQAPPSLDLRRSGALPAPGGLRVPLSETIHPRGPQIAPIPVAPPVARPNPLPVPPVARPNPGPWRPLAAMPGVPKYIPMNRAPAYTMPDNTGTAYLDDAEKAGVTVHRVRPATPPRSYAEGGLIGPDGEPVRKRKPEDEEYGPAFGGGAGPDLGPVLTAIEQASSVAVAESGGRHNSPAPAPTAYPGLDTGGRSGPDWWNPIGDGTGGPGGGVFTGVGNGGGGGLGGGIGDIGGGFPTTTQYPTAPVIPDVQTISGGQSDGRSFETGGEVGPGGQNMTPQQPQGQPTGGPTMDPKMVELQIRDAARRNPEKIAQIREVIFEAMRSGELTGEELNQITAMARTALQNPQMYPQLRNYAIQNGVAAPEDIPEQFDEGLIVMVLIAAQAVQSQDPGGTPPAGSPPVAGGPPPANGPALMSMKDGGKLPEKSPHASGVVPINAHEGEYVIPKEVVRAKGTEFFDKMLERYKNGGNGADC